MSAVNKRVSSPEGSNTPQKSTHCRAYLGFAVALIVGGLLIGGGLHFFGQKLDFTAKLVIGISAGVVYFLFAWLVLKKVLQKNSREESGQGSKSNIDKVVKPEEPSLKPDFKKEIEEIEREREIRLVIQDFKPGGTYYFVDGYSTWKQDVSEEELKHFILKMLDNSYSSNLPMSLTIVKEGVTCIISHNRPLYLTVNSDEISVNDPEITIEHFFKLKIAPFSFT